MHRTDEQTGGHHVAEHEGRELIGVALITELMTEPGSDVGAVEI